MRGQGGGNGGMKAIACLLFVVPHVAAIRLGHGSDSPASYAFLIAAPWIAVFACLRFARRDRATVRIAWLLFAGGLALWGCGMIVAAWSDLVRGASPLIANATDFFYFYYGIGIILALGLPDRGDLVRRFFWIDALQAGLAGYLAYVAIFDVAPFSGVASHPVSASLLVETYNAENAILVAAATLRVLGRSADPQRRSFDRSALWFLLCYGSCAALYNAWTTTTSFAVGPDEILIDIPFLVLAMRRPGHGPGTDATPGTSPGVGPDRHPLTLLVDGAAPTFFTLALLSLSFVVARRQFALGTVAMVVAMVLYAFRAGLLQAYHLRTQDALAAASDQLLRLSLQDDLTGIPNRRAFKQAIELLWPGRYAAASPLCLLLVDIDHFKSINDTLGHKAGDECLFHVAVALREGLEGAGGQVFRYGGEEFAVLLPDRAPDQACSVAETLLDAVRRLQIVNRTACGEHVTISIGIAARTPAMQTPTELMSAADRALYVAKNAGRDQVAFGPAGPAPGDEPQAAPEAAAALAAG
jgi:diguanylate cyclase (GGDEF)-like protein